ncbi:hypothetical protein CCACVL1_10138 [Corchorus capsularis]|uniref:Uncharacterized protein n=1 Tax=Corchorus capsularis TaxID=210143 RepID=A0A1R3ISG6_COCAP|nr:hypothetical protein CCACVL1_10138 [Corchorus capsularis]
MNCLKSKTRSKKPVIPKGAISSIISKLEAIQWPIPTGNP